MLNRDDLTAVQFSLVCIPRCRDSLGCDGCAGQGGEAGIGGGCYQYLHSGEKQSHLQQQKSCPPDDGCVGQRVVEQVLVEGCYQQLEVAHHKAKLGQGGSNIAASPQLKI